MKILYPAKAAVSVWVGSFPSETDFDRCIDDEVVRRLNLQTPIESLCEVAFEPTPVPFRKLIEGFSGWETFVVQVESAAKNKGIQSANAALVFYYLKCEDAPESWGALHFLGSFTGQDVNEEA
jgi:hypothetical protein